MAIFPSLNFLTYEVLVFINFRELLQTFHCINLTMMGLHQRRNVELLTGGPHFLDLHRYERTFSHDLGLKK